MNSSIWSNLPFDLLIRVIEVTEDENTIEQWCTATVASPELHKFVQRQQWKTTKINEEDLVISPEEPAWFSRKRMQRLRRLGMSTDAGIKVRRAIEVHADGTALAYYIQNPVLDFRMIIYSKCGAFARFRPEDLVPSVESLDYTLTLLVPFLVNVRQVHMTGLLTRSMLSVITGLPNSSKIHTLRLRTQGIWVLPPHYAWGPIPVFTHSAP